MPLGFVENAWQGKLVEDNFAGEGTTRAAAYVPSASVELTLAKQIAERLKRAFMHQATMHHDSFTSTAEGKVVLAWT